MLPEGIGLVCGSLRARLSSAGGCILSVVTSILRELVFDGMSGPGSSECGEGLNAESGCFRRSSVVMAVHLTESEGMEVDSD